VRIYLVGPRGSGKTTVARALADALGWAWRDADAALVEAAGRSIRELFESEGEAGFRDRESAVLRELARCDRHVIATGGGVVLRPENRELLRATGLVVRLTADVATLCQRLSSDATTAEQRPGLTGRAAADPEEVAVVVAAREPLYAATAHVTVDTAGKSVAAIVAEVVATWSSASPLR